MPTTTRLLSHDPILDIAAYAHDGGTEALEDARRRGPAETIELIERSGLRGRGGAGFPTGRKWRSLRETGRVPAVVVNAAEGEPGTFKDRSLLRANPYLVLEGALLAAESVGADRIVVAITSTFTVEIERVRQAIDEIEASGWCAPGMFEVFEGPHEYLFGEDSAMLQAISGGGPFPRTVPVYRHGLADHRDLFDVPATLVNNVETLANVPGIIRHGPGWFRLFGTKRSPGTILCTVTGDIARHGVAEFPMGTTVAEVLDTFGGHRDRVATVLLGVAGPPLGADHLDVRLTYEAMAAAGSGLGSASLIVVGTGTSLFDVAAGVSRFLAVESCGQCEPCKLDGLRILEALRSGDVDLAKARVGTVARGARCGLAGEHERTVGRLLALAERDGTGDPSHVTPWPIAPLVDIVDGRAVLDLEHLDKRPDWTYEGEGPETFQSPVERLQHTPVAIRRPSIRERAEHPTAAPIVESSLAPEHYAALQSCHRRIGAALGALQRATTTTRLAALRGLAQELRRHRDVVERYIYPAVQRYRPDDGADITWYPRAHEHHAQRLIEQMTSAPATIDAAAIDELVADVRVSLLELDERIVPILAARHDADADVDAARLERDIEAAVDADVRVPG